jgi:hypothetical protein
LERLHFGARNALLSARFSAAEVTTIDLLVRHAGTDISTWFRSVLMLVVHQWATTEEGLNEVQTSVATFKLRVKGLGRTEHVRHVRYAESLHAKVEELCALLNIKPGTFLRWLLAEFAQETLSKPSKAEQAAAYDALQQQLLDRRRQPAVNVKAL